MSMKLDEMGIVGRQAKISDDAPEHAGELGRIVTATSERAYIEFPNGDKEWFLNKWIVGTRKVHAHEDKPQLTEMAAKKQCDKCGKTMAAYHYWYKGGWKCKGGGKSADDKPAEKKVEEKKPEQASDKPAERKLPSGVSASMHAANEEAANKRAASFHAHLEREVEAKKKAADK
jgi:hypothetical protein